MIDDKHDRFHRRIDRPAYRQPRFRWLSIGRLRLIRRIANPVDRKFNEHMGRCIITIRPRQSADFVYFFFLCSFCRSTIRDNVVLFVRYNNQKTIKSTSYNSTVKNIYNVKRKNNSDRKA